jgi:retinol dehydrogenase-12
MGITLSSMLSESFPPKPKYAVTDIPDLSGKVMIVTGANTGLGKETAKVCTTSFDNVLYD